MSHILEVHEAKKRKQIDISVICARSQFTEQSQRSSVRRTFAHMPRQ